MLCSRASSFCHIPSFLFLRFIVLVELCLSFLFFVVCDSFVLHYLQYLKGIWWISSSLLIVSCQKNSPMLLQWNWSRALNVTLFNFRFILLVLVMCICVYLCGCVQMSVGIIWVSWKYRWIVSYQTWMLESELHFLKEQHVLLTSEPSPWVLVLILNNHIWYCFMSSSINVFF